MSVCTKDLYDYDLAKKCSKCKIISLKINFNNDSNKNDGYNLERNFCSKEYYYVTKDWLSNNRKRHVKKKRAKINLYQKKVRENDFEIKLSLNIRYRIFKAFKSHNVKKLCKTFEVKGCSHNFFRKWIIYQLYVEMTIENSGSMRCIDSCLAFASFNLLDENVMKECFNWINLILMYVKDNEVKGDNIDMRL